MQNSGAAGNVKPQLQNSGGAGHVKPKFGISRGAGKVKPKLERIGFQYWVGTDWILVWEWN